MNLRSGQTSAMCVVTTHEGKKWKITNWDGDPSSKEIAREYPEAADKKGKPSLTSAYGDKSLI